MPREIATTFEITRTYRVTAYGESEDECYDNINEKDYEFIDEQIEVVDTQYASF